MKFTYRLIRDVQGYVAECVEADAAGEGRTVTEAVECLRRSIEERMFRPDAVAPPSDPKPAPIELEPASEPPSQSR